MKKECPILPAQAMWWAARAWVQLRRSFPGFYAHRHATTHLHGTLHTCTHTTYCTPLCHYLPALYTTYLHTHYILHTAVPLLTCTAHYTLSYTVHTLHTTYLHIHYTSSVHTLPVPYRAVRPRDLIFPRSRREEVQLCEN